MLIKYFGAKLPVIGKGFFCYFHSIVWHTQKICRSQLCCTSLPAFLYVPCSCYVHQRTGCTVRLFRVLSPKFGSGSGQSHSNLSSFHLSVSPFGSSRFPSPPPSVSTTILCPSPSLCHGCPRVPHPPQPQYTHLLLVLFALQASLGVIIAFRCLNLCATESTLRQ